MRTKGRIRARATTNSITTVICFYLSGNLSLSAIYLTKQISPNLFATHLASVQLSLTNDNNPPPRMIG